MTARRTEWRALAAEALAATIRAWREGENAEAHGRRSRTVQPLVGSFDSQPKGE